MPKGTAIRVALERSFRFYYILAGKAVCSFLQESEFEERVKLMGIDLELAHGVGGPQVGE